MLTLVCLKFCLLFTTLIGNSVDDTSTLEYLQSKTNFNIYIPSKLHSASNFEIKEPYDFKQAEVPFVLVNYFNESGSYVFGLRQLKNNSYITKEITEFDVKKKTQTTKKIKQKFTLEPLGEQVLINGSTGWYETYKGGEDKGGVLRWVNDGTYIEMDTIQLSKSAMINIAESMKKLTQNETAIK